MLLSRSSRTECDDRFFTPRTHTNSSDNDDKDSRFDTARERITPRQRGSFNSLSSTSPNPTPRYSSPRQFESPRQGIYGESPRQGSEGEYITPRSARNSIEYNSFEYKANEITMMRQGYGMMQRGEEKPPPSYRSEEKYITQSNSPNYDQKYQDYGYSAPSPIQSKYPSSPKPSIPLPRGYNNPYTNTYHDNNTHDNVSTSSYGIQSAPENKVEEEYTLGYGVSENDVEELFSYARHGRIVEIERHLDKGIPIDVRDAYGNTLLIIACQNGNKRVAKLLLRRGSNINGRNHKGNTPLHYCFHYGYGDTLGQYLMTKGADNSARNNFGKLPWDGI